MTVNSTFEERDNLRISKVIEDDQVRSITKKMRGYICEDNQGLA